MGCDQFADQRHHAGDDLLPIRLGGHTGYENGDIAT